MKIHEKWNTMYKLEQDLSWKCLAWKVLRLIFYLSDSIQVNEAVGGVISAVCASFLSQLEVYHEDIGLVARTNTAQHKCVLFPISCPHLIWKFSASMILRLLSNIVLCC